jgi:hypothetical protein
MRARMLTLDSGVMLCRPCAGRVSAFLCGATTALLEGLWGHRTTASTTEAASPSESKEGSAGFNASDVIHLDEVFAAFRAGVARTIHVEDFKAHWDLGIAYTEMGLHADAIRAMATSLDERASQDMAQDAFAFVFAPPRAVPDALDVVVAALQRS